VYFMIYQMTAEEHKYLASLRKEKDAFERLSRQCCSQSMKTNVLGLT